MALTVLDCLNAARFLLNDVSALKYTNAKLLPAFRDAYQELEDEMIDTGHPMHMERAAPQTIPALALVLTTIPTNMIEPIDLEERAVASTFDYTPMKRRMWEPNIQQGETLQFWVWREGAVVFLGATIQREVRLYYHRMLAAIVNETSNVEVVNAKNFLSSRTAALAAFVISQDSERASALAQRAGAALYKLTGTQIKNRQSLPTRRRPYRAFRRFS